MTINENLQYFVGLQVADVDPAKGLGADPASVAHRVRASFDDYEELAGDCLIPRLDAFAAMPGADQVTALVIGAWGRSYENPSTVIVSWLVEHAARLPSLRALFFGDISFEECEISWIEQSDVTPILAAYPRLEFFGVRGGNLLGLSPFSHERLRQLVIQAGGLDAEIVRAVGASALPALEHVELWLGDGNYGATATVADLEPILQHRLPVVSLALRNAEITDDIAAALATAPVVPGLRNLDLSLGTLGDEGGRALLAGQSLAHLVRLDLHHHYMSEEVAAQLAACGAEQVDVSDRQDEDEFGRYVSVGE